MGRRASHFAIFRHLEAGRLRAVVDRVLPLGKVREAHRLLEDGAAFGKIILTP
jgi:NADPH2:quinone reductase